MNVTPLAPIQFGGGAVFKWAQIAGCVIFQMRFKKAGLMTDNHRHTIDHALLVAYGAIRLSVNGTVQDISAGNIVKVCAGYPHDFTSLQDDTVCYCIVPNATKSQVEELLDDVVVSVEKP